MGNAGGGRSGSGGSGRHASGSSTIFDAARSDGWELGHGPLRPGDVLAIDRIKAIHQRIPDTHLVMHGSSSVPEDLLAIINQYGGKMKETYGVPVEEIQEAIKHGVRKINIDTDNRMAITGAIRKALIEKPGEFDPRAYLKPAKEAMRKLCQERYLQFGCEGMAAKIKPIPLEKMAERYKAGELAQIEAARVGWGLSAP